MSGFPDPTPAQPPTGGGGFGPPTAPGGGLPPPGGFGSGGPRYPVNPPPGGGGANRNRNIALIVGGVVAAIALVAGIVVATSGDDGGDERTTDASDERRDASDTTDERGDTTDTTDEDGADTTDNESAGSTDEGADSTADESTTTSADDGATTTTDDVGEATTTSAGGGADSTGGGGGPPPAPPSSVTPPPVTSVSQGIYPADATALRATLDAFAFPSWWPIPDSSAGPGDPYPTVQSISARDSLYVFDEVPEGSNDWNTSWLDPNPDINAVEAAWTAKVPSDRFDVVAGIADKSTTVQEGQTSISYYFDPIGVETGYLSVDLQQAVTDDGQQVGVFVDLFFSGPTIENPTSLVPVGSGTGKQFLALAPASEFLRWESTAFDLSGGSGIVATTPYGSYEASQVAAPDDYKSVIDFLADPANFTGGLTIAGPGSESSGLWTQPMAYGDLAGEYTILTPSAGDTGDLYVRLSFELPD